MLKLCRLDIRKSKEAFEKIERYTKEVVKKLNPKCVILFGSFAKGDINEGSDIDILVVADFKEGFLDRIGSLLKLNRFGIPIEPIGYTPEEFKLMRRQKNSFIEEVLRNCRILYGKI